MSSMERRQAEAKEKTDPLPPLAHKKRRDKPAFIPAPSSPAIFDVYAGALRFGSPGLAHDRRGHRADQALQVPECPLWLHCDPSGGTGPGARWLSGSPGQLDGRPRHHRRRCIQARCPGLLRRVSSIWASYAPYLLKIAVTFSGEANSPLSAAAMPFWTSATNQA